MTEDEITDYTRIAELAGELSSLVQRRMTDRDIGSIAIEVDSVHELHQFLYLLADTAKEKLPGIYSPPGF